MTLISSWRAGFHPNDSTFSPFSLIKSGWWQQQQVRTSSYFVFLKNSLKTGEFPVAAVMSVGLVHPSGFQSSVLDSSWICGTSLSQIIQLELQKYEQACWQGFKQSKTNVLIWLKVKCLCWWESYEDACVSYQLSWWCEVWGCKDVNSGSWTPEQMYKQSFRAHLPFCQKKTDPSAKSFWKVF